MQRPLLNPFVLRKLSSSFDISSFFDDQLNRTCTPSGLLLPSQTGYQSVRQALSSRSTVCYHTENQSRYDTLTVLTSFVTPPQHPIYSTPAISHPPNLHLLHLSHHLHSLRLTSLTSPSTSSRSEVDAATLPPWPIEVIGGAQHRFIKLFLNSPYSRVHPTFYILHQVHSFPDDY